MSLYKQSSLVMRNKGLLLTDAYILLNDTCRRGEKLPQVMFKNEPCVNEEQEIGNTVS